MPLATRFLTFINWANPGFTGMAMDGIFIDGSTFVPSVPNPQHFLEDKQHPDSVAHGLLANA